VRLVPPERLREFAVLFVPKAEVIADFARVHVDAQGEATADSVLEMVRRHPATLDGIVVGLAADREPVARALRQLRERGQVRESVQGGKTYYLPSA
jgi:hypothetical protein